MLIVYATLRSRYFTPGESYMIDISKTFVTAKERIGKTLKKVAEELNVSVTMLRTAERYLRKRGKIRSYMREQPYTKTPTPHRKKLE